MQVCTAHSLLRGRAFSVGSAATTVQAARSLSLMSLGTKKSWRDREPTQVPQAKVRHFLPPGIPSSYSGLGP